MSCLMLLGQGSQHSAPFGMKNAPPGKAGFNLKWAAMNNQQEEQQVGAAEAGGEFLSPNLA